MKKSQIIKSLFEKRVDFENNTYELPTEAFAVSKWSSPSFQTEKADLNRTKSLLNNFNLEEWSRHTKHRDPSSYIPRTVKKKFHAELVTQAWCKFYECLKNFPVVPKEADVSGVFTSVHLCEAPGAFISALNHFLASEGLGVDWQWCANTLNPDYEGNSLQEMIPDDRLLRYTYQNWEFGVDGTGDITKYHNHTDLVQKMQHKIWLVTADGSVDCSSDPGNQELHVEFLHYCETMTALQLLKTGGTFVLKIFTSFEDSTICLLYLLTTLFEKVSTFKPASSKGGNSEVYIICLNYKSVPKLSLLWDSLIVPYKTGRFDPDKSMFALHEINKDFLGQLLRISVFFKTKQIETINGNISKFKKERQDEAGRVHQVKVYVANRYINRYKLKSIDPERKLGTVEGAYLQNDVKKLNFIGSVFKFRADLVKTDILEVKIGARIPRVNSSRFCLKHHLSKLKYTGGPKMSLYQSAEKIITDSASLLAWNDCNFKTNDEFQKHVFYTIFTSSKNHLVLVKIPLVTNFLVGLLYILVSVYEEVYFHQSGFLILYDFSGEKIKLVKSILRRVDEAYRTLPEFSTFTCDIIQLVAPVLLYNNIFFDFVWNYNNVVLSKL